MGRTYRTMQGKEIDMDKLMVKNELMPAIGNAKVNARGDELGNGGKILKKREEVVADYYESNPKAKSNKVIQTEIVTEDNQNNRNTNDSKRKN